MVGESLQGREVKALEDFEPDPRWWVSGIRGKEGGATKGKEGVVRKKGVEIRACRWKEDEGTYREGGENVYLKRQTPSVVPNGKFAGLWGFFLSFCCCI